jgi:hypothetical protein
MQGGQNFFMAGASEVFVAPTALVIALVPLMLTLQPFSCTYTINADDLFNPDPNNSDRWNNLNNIDKIGTGACGGTGNARHHYRERPRQHASER